MTKLDSWSAALPRAASSGFVALVSDHVSANTSVPWAMVTDSSTLDVRNLHRERRREIRRSLEAFDFQVTRDPEPLLRDGFALAVSAALRTGREVPGSVADYRHQIELEVKYRSPIFVTARRDGELLGYMGGWVLGSTAHVSMLEIGPSRGGVGVGNGLYWITMRTLGASEGVQRLNFGLWFPERPGIDAHKRGYGIRTHSLRARGWLNPAVAGYLKRRRPAAYLRLGGADLGLRARLGVPLPDLVRR